MRTATQLSSNESQQQRSRRCRMNDEQERQFLRAVSESQLDSAAPRKNEANIKEEESQIQMALERSAEDDRHRQQLTEEEYERELILAMEQSTHEANTSKVSGGAYLAENEEDE